VASHKKYYKGKCRNPTLAKCEDETHTPKVEDLESSGTPECLELDKKGQNTSPWGVLGVIGKVLKCRCPKWPCIGHLDICNPSYGQKKGRESNWQSTKSQESTSSRRLNLECNMALESSWRELQVWFRPCPDRRSGEKLQCPKVPGVQNRNSFGTPLWESRDKQPLGCGCGGVT
jgi:hypothetical protein